MFIVLHSLMKSTLSLVKRSVFRNIKKPVSMTRASSSLVSPQYVAERLHELKVLDASWFMPTTGRKAIEEYRTERIPGSKFLDVDGIADLSSGLPHMLPTAAGFDAALNALDITPKDSVVFVDRQGIFSSPRAWYTFKCCGFPGSLMVMEGGFPAWKLLNLPLETDPVDEEKLMAPSRAAQAASKSESRFVKDESRVRSLEQMLLNIASKQEKVIDARPAGRFYGKDPEPRASLRGGHIPGSKSIPFPSVLDSNSSPGQTKYKGVEEIKKVFVESGIDVDRDEIIATCGSGMTACILALGFYEVTGRMISLYDGSWTEYGAQPNTPISTSDDY
jgi:thiosulfate/3-mercaptopyruvate sulfurtransferase